MNLCLPQHQKYSTVDGMATEGILGILLAAGISNRFGQDKQAALIDGQPMLRRAARTLLDADLASPIVVLGPRAAAHRRLLDGLPLQFVENPNAASGMASSLRLALQQALEQEPSCQAIVVTVCDQPAVTPAHLQALVTRWRQGGCTLVASSYAPQPGVPALIAATHFAELAQLEGDRGAGPLFARHASQTAQLPLPQGALDIDTPPDLERYLQARTSSR
jgi:molybdenum cofactor cytidylyltransferase